LTNEQRKKPNKTNKLKIAGKPATATVKSAIKYFYIYNIE